MPAAGRALRSLHHACRARHRGGAGLVRCAALAERRRRRRRRGPASRIRAKNPSCRRHTGAGTDSNAAMAIPPSVPATPPARSAPCPTPTSPGPRHPPRHAALRLLPPRHLRGRRQGRALRGIRRRAAARTGGVKAWPLPPASPCGSTPIPPGYPPGGGAACAFPARRERLPAPEQQLRAFCIWCLSGESRSEQVRDWHCHPRAAPAGRCGCSVRIARPIARPIAASGHRQAPACGCCPPAPPPCSRAFTRPRGGLPQPD